MIASMHSSLMVPVKWLLFLGFFVVIIHVVHAQSSSDPAGIDSLAWSPDGTMIAVSGGALKCDPANLNKFAVRIFSAITGQIIKNLVGHTCYTTSVDWNSTGSKIVSASSGEEKAYVWDVASGNILISTPATAKGISTVVWQPNGNLIASAFIGNTITTWDSNSGALNLPSGIFGSIVDWNPSGNRLVAAGGYSADVSIFNASTRQEEMKMVGHTDTITSVAWSPDGNKIASGSRDRTIKIWNANTGVLLLTLQGHTDIITAVAWKSTGDILATSSADRTIRYWSIATGQLLSQTATTQKVDAVVWSPDGTKIAYATEGGTIQFVPAPAPTPTPTPPPSGSGTGLLGQYYDNIDLTNWKLNRVNSTVNFDWILGSPDPLIGVDTFSARWTGQVVPQYSQTYTFYTQTDDGVRLWVNNQQVINDWTNHGTTENTGTIALTAGTRYNIRMEYYDAGSAAVARLYWSSSSQPKQIIPTDRLLPNGRIAFQTNRDGNDEIYTMNADGSSLVNLTGNSGSDTYPTTATGTQKIVFASSRTGDYEIDSMGLTGGTVTNLTQNGSYDQYPSQAPDGRIAFSSTRNGGNFNLYKINADGTGLTQLTNTSTIAERFSSWSPDGQWIVYEATDSNNVHDLWKIPAAGGTPIRLTQNAGSNMNPDWSPDGTTIVFISSRDTGGHYIFLMNADGSNQRPFRTGGLNGFEPSWSPDGTYISYHAWANVEPEVYTIALGGATPTALTNNNVVDGYPSWDAQ